MKTKRRLKVVVDLQAGMIFAPDNIEVVIIQKGDQIMDGDGMSMAKAERERQLMEEADEREKREPLTADEICMAMTAVMGAKIKAENMGDYASAAKYQLIFDKLFHIPASA